MSTFRFKFENQSGFVDYAGTPNEFVRWGGMGFQINAASPALRARIEAARKFHAMHAATKAFNAARTLR